MSVATTSDQAGASANVDVVASHQVAQLTGAPADNTPGRATTYALDFHTSSTGGMSAAAQSQISITFPTGTVFANQAGGTIVDGASGQSIGSCPAHGGLVLLCSFNNGVTVPAGHELKVTATGAHEPDDGRDVLAAARDDVGHGRVDPDRHRAGRATAGDDDPADRGRPLHVHLTRARRDVPVRARRRAVRRLHVAVHAAGGSAGGRPHAAGARDRRGRQRRSDAGGADLHGGLDARGDADPHPGRDARPRYAHADAPPRRRFRTRRWSPRR